MQQCCGMLPPMKHGNSLYNNYGCRCAVCRAGHAAYAARIRDRKRGTEPPQHGYSAYVNYGCRCEVCRMGNRRRRSRAIGLS